MTKQEEKTLIGEMFRAIRIRAGENSYINDIFNVDLENEISRNIDADTVFPSFREIEETKRYMEKENTALIAENTRLLGIKESLSRANQALSADLAKVKASIADLYQWSRK